MKICTKCNIEKNEEDFRLIDKIKKLFRSRCKKCEAKERREYRKLFPDKIKAYNFAYHNANKQKESNRCKEYYQQNLEKRRQYHAEYREKHRKELLEKSIRYVKNRLEVDINYRLAHNLRIRSRAAVKGNFKSGSAVKDLGCSVDELKAYLESKFYVNPKTGEVMTWENWNFRGWHIDHIKPLADFDLTSREQYLEAAHYTNLQPLWAEQNLKKGKKLWNYLIDQS